MIVRKPITDILISPSVEEYIYSRNLLESFIKRKNKVLNGQYASGIRLKILQPKHKRLFSSRLNKKYRIICVMEWSICKVLAIDDHQ